MLSASENRILGEILYIRNLSVLPYEYCTDATTVAR
ncbi:hypothetical protein Hjap01_04344 [Haloarcula japonica]